MREHRPVVLSAVLALLAAGPAAADPPGAGAKVGDRLAPYTPTTKIGARGAAKCETC
jgi:hypothetical protein